MLEQVGVHHRLVLITKGELVHQTAKVDVSGLAHHFEQIEIVMEKDAGTYARIIRSLGVPTPRFCMVGNSVRSDTLPGHTFAELESLTELRAWLTESTTVRDG